MIKNEHLLPAPVKELGVKLCDKTTHQNEKHNIAARLEAILLYCEKVLEYTGFKRG